MICLQSAIKYVTKFTSENLTDSHSTSSVQVACESWAEPRCLHEDPPERVCDNRGQPKSLGHTWENQVI